MELSCNTCWNVELNVVLGPGMVGYRCIWLHVSIGFRPEMDNLASTASITELHSNCDAENDPWEYVKPYIAYVPSSTNAN